MSTRRWLQCTVLLVLVGIPVSIQGLQTTSYGGWPAVGFATALFLTAGRRHVWLALGAETVVVATGLTFSYAVSPLYGFLGSVAVTVPALLTAYLIGDGMRAPLRLETMDSGRYHAATAASALLCGVAGAGLVATFASPRTVLLSGLMSFLAALTAQLAVLPLVVSTAPVPAKAGPFELTAQRLILAVVTLGVFWPSTSLSVSFLVFPILAWAALRATRRETHIQLFAVCVTAYALTFSGRGPMAQAHTDLPTSVAPAVFYLFVAAACYLTVPLTLTVEQLFSMSAQASRAATTVQRLIDSATHTLFIATDEAGRITHYNPGAQRTLGYTLGEVLGRSPAMFHTQEEIARQAEHFQVPPEHARVALAQAANGERRDWAVLHRDGTERMASLSLSQVIDSEGRVRGFIAAGEDITERLRAQDALVAALEREHASLTRLEEVDQVKQDLVSNVSHELRTPITSISGYAELLVDGALGELSAAQQDAVGRIERNTTRLAMLVDDLLTMSRTESGQLDLERHVLDLREVTREAMEMLEELIRVREVDVHTMLPRSAVSMIGDGNALERVVVNLVSNAIKFTPDGGSVTVSVSCEEDWAVLVVRDTGVGISEEDQEHLFTRFFRASVATEQAIQGTGLGLSIVHSIVTQHGGTVDVESGRGRGTEVTVRLPRAR